MAVLSHPPASGEVLTAGAAQLGIALASTQVAQLLRLLDELDIWNQHINLTAIRERPQQITKHLLDSLSLQSLLRGERLIDIGTGAGFPGLPLAVVNPQHQFTLLDGTGKKLKFIEHVTQVLGLTNVCTVHSRAEHFHPAERFQTVMSRAVGPVIQFVEQSGHLCAGGGRLLAMKGKHPQAEVEQLPNGWKLAAIHPVAVPALDEQRHVVELCRSHDKV
jgi:16S rRNA (guanine527-N7)-methyltransferase